MSMHVFDWIDQQATTRISHNRIETKDNQVHALNYILDHGSMIDITNHAYNNITYKKPY
jgi:hypothetical protein